MMATTGQAAKLTGLPRRTIAEWVRLQRVPAKRLGTRWYIDEEGISILRSFAAARQIM